MALLKKQHSSNFKPSTTTCIHYSKQQSLPPGAITEFIWKDYYSDIFRNIQELGDVTYDDYIPSIRRHETLMELAWRGGCGRPFYLSHDDRFVIKTLRKSEAKVLIEMLPSYYHHIKNHKNSLLTKFYGLHAARSGLGGPKVYFVVMENLLQTELQIHRQYDLKGSSQGRSRSKAGAQPSSKLKDLDFDFCFYLDPVTQNQLLEQIKLDCKFLEEHGIMDYSLLLGVHLETPRPVNTQERMFEEAIKEQSKKETTLSESHHRRDPTLSDFFNPSDRSYSRLGSKVRARAIQIPRSEKQSCSSSLSRKARVSENCNVYLFMGIIDFFQDYNVMKKIEHAYKSLLHYDSKEIPSVKPKLYATRFQDFLAKVFLAEDLSPQSVLDSTALS